MKKRITALLLCLVMALSLIPTTVWAAADDGASPQALRTGHQISVKVYKVVLDSSKPLGYQNPELINTITVTCQDSTGHSGYNHSVNLKEFYPTNVGASTTDWTGWEFDSYYTKGKEQKTFYNWTSSTVNATANVTGSEPYPCSKNFYLVYKDSTPVIPDPVASDLGNPVIVDDTTNRHGDFNYPIADADMKTVTGTGATRTVTINSSNYVSRFNAYYNVEHTLTNAAQQTITLTYSNGKWSANPANVTFTVVCEEDKPNDPTKPTDDEVENLLTQNITVVDDTDLHATKNYKLKNVGGSFTVGEVTTKNGQFVCPVTIEFQPFVDQYSKDVEKAHSLTDASVTNTVVELVASYNTETKNWTWAAANKAAITINVECEIPDAPSAEEIANLGKVRVICGTNDKHETKVYDLIPGTYTTTGISELTGNPVESEVYYDEDYEQFVFDIYILNKDEYGTDSVDGITPYVDKYVKEFGTHAVVNTFTMCTLAYNEKSGAWELLQGMIYDEETDEAVLDEYYGAARISVQCVNDPTAKDLKDLGVTANVDCKKTEHTAKDYDLTGNETLTVTKKEANGVWTATVSLSDDSAKAFLKQYSKDIGKSHTELLTSGTVDLVFKNGAWKLADAKKNVLNITTNCSTTDPGTKPGTNPGTRRPYTKDEPKTVESGKTFDAGIAMYVGLSILSVTGSAVVIRKRKDF